jgi:peptidoglycan/xylan/chitin deacetylase (PgdA/CDA1 family)
MGKNIIKEIMGFIVRFSGVSFLLREIIFRNKVTIIHYHDPGLEVMRRHIRYLEKHYNIISLRKLVNAIYIKDSTNIPLKSLIITIDDGNKNNYKLLQLFKANKILPTIYLCSDIIDTNRKYWFKTRITDIEKLKSYENKQRLKVLYDEVEYEQQKEYSTRQALNREELKAMSAYVDFQSHSKYHPVLPTCADQVCKEEIEGSKNILEDLFNINIEHFSYPNGDYSDREIEYLVSSDYKSGRTVDVGWNDVNSNPFKLKSMGIDDDATINILSAQVCGFLGYLRYVKYGSFNGKKRPHI